MVHTLSSSCVVYPHHTLLVVKYCSNVPTLNKALTSFNKDACADSPNAPCCVANDPMP